MSIHSHKSVLLAGAATLAVGAAQPALAQEASFDEEIFVTTERRVQSIQDVAATVQNFSGEDILRLGINNDFSNLQFAVPGLQIANQEGKIEIFLRGIGNSDSDFSSDPAIATHFNGVYVPRPRGFGPLFFDNERVEINKGPQGTLRGRNATGGTINIITAKPTLDEFGGYVMGGVGNFSSRQFEGAINLPITETFAVRGSVWTRKHDGFYTNEFLADNPDPNFDGPSAQDDVAGRLSALWQPSEDLEVYLMWQRSDVNSSGDPGAFSGRSQSAGFDINDLEDPWNQYFRTEGDYDQQISTYLAKIDYQFGDGLGVEYQGSYNTIDAYNQNASREWQLGMVYPGSEAEAGFIASGQNPQRNLLVNDTFYQADQSDSMVHELRFYGEDTFDRLDWSAGAFYFKEEFDYLSWDVGNGFCGNSDFLNAPAPIGAPPAEAGGNNRTYSCWQNGLGGENRGEDSTVESIAFYADGVFDVNDRLRVKAGIRWTQDEKIQNDSNAQYQFNFNADFFEARFGRPSDLIIGEPGFRLAGPAGRILPATYDVATDDGIAIFDSGIQSYGLGDTWGDFITDCNAEGVCQVLISSQFDNGDTPITELRARNEVKDNYVDWRLGVEYDLADDHLLYATVSTGTRSGGINRPLIVGGVQQDITWDPEKLMSFEIGSKNQFDFGDVPMIINASAFYYDYSDRVAQILVDVPNATPENPDATTQQVLTNNVGDAHVLGIEVEGQAILPFGFNVAANILWLDAEYDDATILDSRQNGNNIVPLDGNPLQNTSEWNINARISQNIDVDVKYLNSIDWTLNILYRSEYFLTPFANQFIAADGTRGPITDLPAPNNNGALSDVGGAATPLFLQDRVPGFAALNLNVGANLGEEDQFRIDFWVENLTNTAFSTKGFVNSSVNIRYLNSPRQYGVRLRAKF